MTRTEGGESQGGGRPSTLVYIRDRKLTCDHTTTNVMDAHEDRHDQ